MRKSVVEKLADMKRKRKAPEAMTLEDMFLLLLDGGRPKEQRSANPTQRAFTFDNDPVRFKGYMGPKGCAKTSTLCAAGWLRALLQPGSKGFVGRNDYNDLKGTTALRMSEMLGRLPPGLLLDRSKDPPMKWIIQAVPELSPEGDILCDSPSEITFLGFKSLDEGGSYEFDWGLADEATEITERSILAANGWLRNIPPGKTAEDMIGRYTILMAFNPPDNFHYLYTGCTGLDHNGRKVREPWIKLFLPQPRENQRNLPLDYYESMAKSMPEDMRIRLVEGRWGSTFEGAPVFREFKYDLHARSGLMEKYDPYSPLVRFWDFGYRRPYIVWGQLDWMGRLLRFKEYLGENMEIAPFIHMAKQKQALWFPKHKEFLDYGDPAARQKKDTGSTLGVLFSEGIKLQYKTGMSIDDGLQTMRVWLERIIDGEPAFQYDKEGCPILISAMRGGYHMDKTGQVPVKDGYYDHPVDADRYGVTNLFEIVDYKKIITDLPATLEYNAAQDVYANGGGHGYQEIDAIRRALGGNKQ